MQATEQQKISKPWLKEHQFKKGQSGNPGGRPKAYRQIGRDVLESVEPKDPDGRTRWELGVLRTYAAWMNGSVPAGIFLRDTFYGKPKETHEVYNHSLSVEVIRKILTTQTEVSFPEKLS